jgi:hypothetical protein
MISFISEFSNIFLNYRLIMMNLKMENTFRFTLIIPTIGITFFVFRIVFFPFVIWKIFANQSLIDVCIPFLIIIIQHSNYPMWKMSIVHVLAYSSFIMYLLWWTWFYTMLKIAFTGSAKTKQI